MATALLSSCLKDNSRYVNFAGSPPVVDFPVTANLGTSVTAQLVAANATNQVNFTVGASYYKDIATPTTITVAINPSAVPSGYVLLPATAYTATNFTVTVNPSIEQVVSNQMPLVGTPVSLPPGLAAITFTVTTSVITAAGAPKYVLPLIITTTSGNGAVIDQFNTLSYVLTAK